MSESDPCGIFDLRGSLREKHQLFPSLRFLDFGRRVHFRINFGKRFELWVRMVRIHPWNILSFCVHQFGFLKPRHPLALQSTWCLYVFG